MGGSCPEASRSGGSLAATARRGVAIHDVAVVGIYSSLATSQSNHVALFTR